MHNVNQVTLIGHLGADPEEIETSTGNPMAKFSLATNHMRSGEQVTDWHSITVFGRQAETVLKFLSKGDCCCVQGRIRYDRVGEKPDVRYYTNIVAQRVVFLPSGTKPRGSGVTPGVSSSSFADSEAIPF